MRPEQDAFGRVLLDWLEKGESFEAVERDDGFLWSSGLKHDVGWWFADARRWPAVERRALRFVRGRVLDVGLGAGRVALELQRRGHEVVGIDVSPLAVRVARRRGVKNAKVLELQHLDGSLGRFDTIAMFGNNFGLCRSAAGVKRIFRKLHALTAADGRVVALSDDPYPPPLPAHRAYQQRNRARGRMPGQQRLRLRYLGYATPWFDYLCVSPGEMEALLEGTGWHVERSIRTGEDPYYAAVIEKDRPGTSTAPTV